MRGVDAEAAQLPGDAAERVVADAGDQCDRVTQSGGRHRDIGRSAAQKLAERGDILQADTDLEGVDVHAAAPDDERVQWVRPGHIGSQSVRLGGYDCAWATGRCQPFVRTFGLAIIDATMQP